MSSPWNVEPRRRPVRPRRPVRQGLLFGLVLVAVEVLGPMLPGLGRTIALDVLGPLVGSAWAWAVFAGWLGRGARGGATAAAMGAVGLWSASFVRTVADLALGLVRGGSIDDVPHHLVGGFGSWAVVPLVLGVLAGVLGWLTTRRDALGSAAGIVLALGLAGIMALGLQEAGNSGFRVATAVVGMLAGLAAAGWIAYAAVRRAGAAGADASLGAPETPIRRYSSPPRTPGRQPHPGPTQQLPAYGQVSPTRAWPAATPHAPAADDPTEALPAFPRTPSDPADDGDLPTRPNPLRRW